MKKIIKIAKTLLAAITINSMAMPPKLTQQDAQQHNAAPPISRLNKDVFGLIGEHSETKEALRLSQTSRAIKEKLTLNISSFLKTNLKTNYLSRTSKAEIIQEYSLTGCQIPDGLQSFLNHISDNNEPIHMAIIADENHPLLKTNDQNQTAANLILIPINRSIIPDTIARNLLITGNIIRVQDCFFPKLFDSISTLEHVALQTENLTSFDSSGLSSLTSIVNNFLSEEYLTSSGNK
jgi:hypothetical protein